MPFYISPPPRNPLSAILAALAGGLILVAGFLLGFVVLVVIGGLGILLWLGLTLRIKWAQRKLRKSGFSPEEPLARENQDFSGSSSVIDAEYTVISKKPKD